MKNREVTIDLLLHSDQAMPLVGTGHGSLKKESLSFSEIQVE